MFWKRKDVPIKVATKLVGQNTSQSVTVAGVQGHCLGFGRGPTALKAVSLIAG